MENFNTYFLVDQLISQKLVSLFTFWAYHVGHPVCLFLCTQLFWINHSTTDLWWSNTSF